MSELVTPGRAPHPENPHGLGNIWFSRDRSLQLAEGLMYISGATPPLVRESEPYAGRKVTTVHSWLNSDEVEGFLKDIRIVLVSQFEEQPLRNRFHLGSHSYYVVLEGGPAPETLLEIKHYYSGSSSHSATPPFDWVGLRAPTEEAALIEEMIDGTLKMSRDEDVWQSSFTSVQ